LLNSQVETLLNNKKQHRSQPDAPSSTSEVDIQLSTDLGHKGTVLLLAFCFPPENNSGAARPFRFYKYLRRLGCGVQVVTASKQDLNRVPADVVSVSDTVPQSYSRILLMAARILLGHVVDETSLMWAIRACAAAEELFAREKICAVLCTSPPEISHVAASLLKARYGIRWIADFRDPLVGNPFRKRRGVVSGVLDRVLQSWVFRYADVLIANTDATLKLWQQQYPEYENKMHLIWNGFDPEDILESVPIPKRDHKLLVHAGTVYGPRHPGVLLSSLQRLIQRGLLSPDKFVFQLVGAMEKGWSRDPVKTEELVRLGCLKYDERRVSTEEARRAILSADALVLIDSHAEGGAVQLPAKIFDYVRLGRPILAITTSSSPVDRLLARSGVPHAALYPEDSADEIDRKVMLFMRLPSEPVIASEWFWKEFSAIRQAWELAPLIFPSQQIPQPNNEANV
jgi:glycosyltransferase involved in cell wall biosynthesis